MNLTHFVDISPANLASVVDSVIGCQCVLFSQNGQGDQHVDQLGFGHYLVAHDWDQLLQLLLQS